MINFTTMTKKDSELLQGNRKTIWAPEYNSCYKKAAGIMINHSKMQ